MGYISTYEQYETYFMCQPSSQKAQEHKNLNESKLDIKKESFKPSPIVVSAKVSIAHPPKPIISAKNQILQAPMFQSSLQSLSFMDKPIQIQMSQNDLHLLSHTNYTLLKFFTAFKKTNVEKVVKTVALTNNIVSFSRDQLK